MSGFAEGGRGPKGNDWMTSPKRREQAVFLPMMAAVFSLGALKILVFAKILGAEELAYYGLVLLVVQFGVPLSQWGIMAGLNVELPLALGRGESDTHLMVERGLGAVITAGLATAGIYLVVVTAIGPSDPNVSFALSFAALTTLLAILTEFAILILRAQRRLINLAGVYLTRNSLVVAFGTAAGLTWGYRGVILGEIVALVTAIGFAILVWRIDMRPRWPDWHMTRFLLTAGGPLLISVSLVTGAFLVDRGFVASVIPSQFGQYTFASVVLVASISVQATINQVIPPRLLFERGGGLSLTDLLQRLNRLAAKIVGAGVAGFALLIAVIGLMRNTLFSEYSAALDVMPILYVGAVLGLMAIYEVELIAARRFRMIVLINGTGLIVALTAAVLVTVAGPSLTAYAWVFVVGRAVTALALAVAAVTVTREADRSRRRPPP